MRVAHDAPRAGTEQWRSAPWPARWVTVGGYRLNVRHAEPTTADAEPALYVHGLGGSSLNWTDLMGLLRDRLDGEAPDLPGFGQSPPPDDGNFGLAGHAAAVVALIESRRVGPVHLFGNSLGGAVATRVAAERPDLVRTLTLAAPALPDLRPRRTSMGLPLLAVPGLGAYLARALARQRPERRAEALLELCFGDPGAVPPARRAELAAEIERRARLPYAQDALIASLRGLLSVYLERGPQALWRLAREVSAPTLVVYGGRDKLVDARVAARARATFRDARVLVLPTSGHVPQIEHPDLVADAVRALLDRQATVRVAG